MIAILATIITMISDHAKFTIPQYYDFNIYRPGNPRVSGNYLCRQEHFEQVEMLYPVCHTSRT